MIKKKHEFKQCRQGFLVHHCIYFFTFVMSFFAVGTQAQPNSTACLGTKKVIANLNDQINKLQNLKGSEQFEGPARTFWQQEMQSLKDQLEAEVKIEKEACSSTGIVYTQQATATPNFLVMTVVYAPPGLSGGKSTAYVDYGTGSQTGSSVSSSKTFKQDLSEKATVKAMFDGNGSSVTVGFDVTASKTDKTQLDIKKSQQQDIKVTAPSVDGVDHDEDQIWFWVKPIILVTSSRDGISWSLNTNNQVLQYLTVGQLHNFLNDSTKVDKDDVAKQLKALGFTQSDYSEILSADPCGKMIMRKGQAFIDPVLSDPSRFIRLAQNFTYEPPADPAAGSTSSTYTIKNETMLTNGGSLTTTKQLSISVTVSVGFSKDISASFTVAGKWTWTHETSQTSSTDSTQSATLVIGQPSASYKGFTNVEVYWDRIWQSFVFVPSPLTESILVSGTINNLEGKTVPNTQVTLKTGTSRMITYTNASGHYAFYGPKGKTARNAVLLTGNTRKTITIKTHPTVVNMQASSTTGLPKGK